MLIYIADDEPLLLEDLRDAVTGAEPDAEIKAFEWAQPLLDALKQEKEKPQVAFLDIELPGMSGMELARELKQVSPHTRLVFVTGFAQYAVEAFSLHADGYVMKPATIEKIHEELEHLRPLLDTQPPKRLHVQCFGDFEVFVDGAPLEFSRKRAKELFAYLVDRCGAGSSVRDLVNILWEDGLYDTSRKNQIHSFLSDLGKTLSAVGCGEVLVRQYNSYAVDIDKFDCDFYRLLQNDPSAISHYNGEYMAQYSWAEMTAGTLIKKLL